ncbi:hypothetical protein FQN57_005527 [Myotisia sp. PD_48]|nr:hypothetical protein FQN57_005527 [Myotisia sp. PD_48]
MLNDFDWSREDSRKLRKMMPERLAQNHLEDVLVHLWKPKLSRELILADPQGSPKLVPLPFQLSFSPLFLLTPGFGALPPVCKEFQIDTSILGVRRQKHVRLPNNVPLTKKRRNIITRILQKPSSLQTAYLIARADAQWFRSLPEKVRQQHFSLEEQIRLGGWRASVIFDAADKALYNLADGSFESFGSPTNLSRSSSVNSNSSRQFMDSAIGMDDSVYDSFRWLDEDDDIDLSLDYHTHLAETTAATSRPPTARGSHSRKPSFRRTFSFASKHDGTITPRSGRRPSVHQVPLPLPLTAPSHVSLVSTKSRHRHHRSFSKSTPQTPKHAPKTSVSSIDQPAQFYQDPEARLKLRVYLASPQKFDEAIEFGFPSLEKENVSNRLSIDRKWKFQEATTTFLENSSSASLDERIRKSLLENSKPLEFNLQEPMTHSRKPSIEAPPTPRSASRPSTARRPRPLQLVGSNHNASNMMGNREMTLKMTLTRPDLRSHDSPSTVSSPLPSDADDPLRLAELPVIDSTSIQWDEPVEKGVVKKMWSRLRRLNRQ